MNNKSRDLELEKQIDEYINGKLNEEQSLRLWEELLRHPEYIELLETELEVRRLLQEEKSLQPGEKKPAGYLHRYWKWTAAAASVLILAISLIYLQMDTQQTLEEMTPDSIDLNENLITADITRAETAGLDPADSLLNHGFNMAMEGDVEGALAVYEQIISDYSDNEGTMAEAHLNKGIIFYNLNEYEEAVASFEQTLEIEQDEHSFIREKAYWFLGNSYIHLEEYPQARNALQYTTEMEGLYHEPAQRMMKRLEEERRE